MPSQDARADLVEIRVPARPELISTVRAVAADLAARADFDLDAISDLRMAVDEACSALVVRTSAEHELRCVFVIGAEGIQATVSTVPEPADSAIDTSGFGWSFLRALVDEVHVNPATGGGVGRPRLGIRLVKKGPTM